MRQPVNNRLFDTAEPETMQSPDTSELTELDRELLNAVQWDFPLDPRPYGVLAERLGFVVREIPVFAFRDVDGRLPPGPLRHR